MTFHVGDTVQRFKGTRNGMDVGDEDVVIGLVANPFGGDPGLTLKEYGGFGNNFHSSADFVIVQKGPLSSQDFVVNFNEDGSERVEIAAHPGMSINFEVFSPGLGGVDVAMYPEDAKELVRVLQLAIEVATTGTEF